MPDGSTKTVLANSQAAANNNAGLSATTPPPSQSSSSSGTSKSPGTVTTQTAAPTTAVSSGGVPVYQTKNGQKTVQQMYDELINVGWSGVGEIKDTYARTTGGAVTAAGTTSSSSSTNSVPAATPALQQQGFNQEAANAAMQLANNAAQQEYLRARLNLDTDIEANRKAQQAWQNTFDQEKFKYQQGIDTQQFGLSEAAVTGTYNGAPTLAAQAQQQKTANDYLTLIGNLRGPQDYGQYLKVLGSTPGGLRDLVAGAAGRYQFGGGTTGLAPTPASLGGLLGDVAGTGGTTDYAQFMQAGAGLPSPNQIAPQNYNAMTTTQRQLLGSLYEGQGWMPQDVTDLYKQSLPRYAGPASGAVRLS